MLADLAAELKAKLGARLDEIYPPVATVATALALLRDFGLR